MCFTKIRGAAVKKWGKGETDYDKQEKGRGWRKVWYVPKTGRKERVGKIGERKKKRYMRD